MKKGKSDILSGLPDALIHQIFSFMDMKLVVQTSILSNRWKDLWKSSPAINLHLDYYCSPTQSKRDHFILDVDLAFDLLDVSKLEKVSISSHERLWAKDISRWIFRAKFRNIQVLHLSLLVHDPIELPHDLFTSVRTLSLQSCKLKNWVWVCSADKVKSLKLVSIRFPEGDSRGYLIFNCPDLENLVITYCGINHLKVLTISTPLLKMLALNTAITCDTSICCPSLIYLNCCAFIDKGLSFKDFFSLISADIDIHPYDDSETANEALAQSLSNILLEIYKIKSLTLKDFLIKEIVSYHLDLLKKIPGLFHNLKHILVKDWDGDLCMDALANFLRILPQMETLVWDRSQTGCNLQKTERNQGVDTSGDNIFCCLKTFEIRSPQLVENELIFMELLLKRAIVLTEVIVKTTCTDSLYKSKLTEFKEKVLAFPRISPSVSLSLHSERY